MDKMYIAFAESYKNGTRYIGLFDSKQKAVIECGAFENHNTIGDLKLFDLFYVDEVWMNSSEIVRVWTTNGDDIK